MSQTYSEVDMAALNVGVAKMRFFVYLFSVLHFILAAALLTQAVIYMQIFL